MASPEVYDAIRAKLTADYSATPLRFENEDAQQPQVGSGAWCLCEFASTTYRQESIGAGAQRLNRFDEEGSFFINVMVPLGSGVREAFGYAYILADLFRGLTLMGGALEFEDVMVGYGGPDDNGNWYGVTVSIGWRLMNSREQ
jgi:hypothetical protein